MDQFEFFGNEYQVKLQQRYYRLWPYLKAHPRLSFAGRAIGLDEPRLDEEEDIAGLAKELGFLALAFTRAEIIDDLRSALEARGLKVGIWQHLVSSDQAKASCHAVATSLSLPTGYQIDRISTTTPAHRLINFQKLMQRCGVAPLPGYILRNHAVPTIAEMIIDPNGEVVATGAGIFRHNPQGPFGKAVHVGFLATEPGQRGKGFASLLLAQILLACFQEYAAVLAHTGVRAENIPSQRVCQRCGLQDSGTYFLGVMYPLGDKQAEFTR